MATKKQRWILGRRWPVIKRYLRRLIGERSTPGRLAWAVWAGIVVGALPFFGFHYLMAILIATLCGLNRPLTLLATNITFPPLAPFVIFASIQLGSLVLTGSWMPLSIEQIKGAGPFSFFQNWMIGSVIFGVLAGIPFALGTYAWARKARRVRAGRAGEPVS